MAQPEPPATVSAEPVPSKPVPAEPAVIEPSHAEPAPTMPARAEPAPAEPAPTIPTRAEPAPTEPIPSQRDMQAVAPMSPVAPSAPAQEPPSASLPPPAAAVTEPPKTMALEDVFFDFDRHTIRTDAQTVLESNAAWIKNSGANMIVIEGHCDERGTQAYNLVLGERRAKATQRYLQDLGIPLSRLKIVSYGELRPFCKEHSEDCYQSNRRAHFAPQ